MNNRARSEFRRPKDILLIASTTCLTLASLIPSTRGFCDSRAASVSPLPANPASSVFLLKSSGAFSAIPISSNDVKLRYVGSDAITKKAESPISFGEIQGGFALKPSKRVSFGVGDLIPPVSVNRTIDDIPIVILNDVSLVDLDIQANVKYGITLFGGYLVNDRLSVGASFSSRQIDVKATAKTNSEQRLLDGHFRLTDSAGIVGANYVVRPNQLRVGVAAAIFSSSAIMTSIETPLVSGPNASALNNKGSSSNLAFGNFLFGVDFKPNGLTELFADAVWKRADKNQQEFSLVDLKEKPKDIYDTVSIFLGGKYRVQDRQFALAGFSYEPSAVGSGTKGEDGKSGFGMKETALLYSGFGDLLPAWSISIGLQYGEGLKTISESEETRKSDKTKSTSNPDKRQASTSIWDRTTFSLSLRYRRSSLGIDENGELPAAYSQVRMQFPFSVQSSF